jgi:hypothetical protein
MLSLVSYELDLSEYLLTESYLCKNLFISKVYRSVLTDLMVA